MEMAILLVLAAVLALQAAVLILLLRRRGDAGGEELKAVSYTHLDVYKRQLHDYRELIPAAE